MRTMKKNRLLILLWIALIMPLSAHALKPTAAQKQDFMFYARGIAGNSKDARQVAFYNLSKNIAYTLQRNYYLSDEQYASTLSLEDYQIANNEALDGVFLIEDFEYLNLGRKKTERHVIAGITENRLKDIAQRLHDQLSQPIHWTLLSVEELESIAIKMRTLSRFINLFNQRGIAHKPEWKENILAIDSSFSNRYFKGLLILDGKLGDGLIYINHRSVDNNEIFLTPGIHHFRIARSGYHVLEGRIQILAKEIRHLPYTLIPDSQLTWPIRLQITKELEDYQFGLISQLRLLNFSFQDEAVHSLSVRLTKKSQFSELYNHQEFRLSIALHRNKQLLHEQIAHFEFTTGLEDEAFTEESLQAFITSNLFAFTSKLNFNQSFLTEHGDTEIEAAFIIE